MAETAMPRLKMNFYVEIDWENDNKKQVNNIEPAKDRTVKNEHNCSDIVNVSNDIVKIKETEAVEDTEKTKRNKSRKRTIKKKTESDAVKSETNSTAQESEQKPKEIKKRGPKKKKHACPSCDLVFDTKTALNSHFLSHTGVKPYSCYLCHQSFTQPFNLTRHMYVHSNSNTIRSTVLEVPKPFQCNTCGYSSTSKSLLKLHIRVHTGEKPYSCTYCPYKSALKCNLKTHILTHTLEKPFSCQKCDYKCARKSTLKVHTRCHLTDGSKPYGCEKCDRKFSRKGYLIVHMKSHCEERPFRCDICSYTCKYKMMLQRHRLIHNHK